MSSSPLDHSPVVPVVQLPADVDPATAGVGIAAALLAGGISVIEVTLRTSGALDAIRAIRAEVPAVRVGAGSVLDPETLGSCLAAGAEFVVTPGTSSVLRRMLLDVPVPVLPGAATVSEVLELRDAGFREVKVFPAAPLGGPAFLASMLAPVRDMRVCPTGGVTADTAPDYLALDQVPCVGGSWVAPPALVRAGDWAAITSLARHAAGLEGSPGR